jgi:sugar phosphate isomerase/epimerase
MHPRLTVLSRVCDRQLPVAQVLDQLALAGAVRAGLSASEVDGATDTVRAAAAEITHIGHGPLGGSGDDGSAVVRSIDLAAAVGAGCVYGPAYGDPSLEWEDAARHFIGVVASGATYARERDVALLIEPTITLLADISMLHTLEDTLELAERSGVGVCIDVQHCWTERRLRESITACGERIGLVQLSDWVPGNRHHFRAVPGDGVIPLDRIVGWILDTGYTGLFDLELSGEPNIPHTETIARAIDRADALLERAGA